MGCRSWMEARTRAFFTSDVARHPGPMIDCGTVACLVSVAPCRPVSARLDSSVPPPEVCHVAGIGIDPPAASSPARP